MKLFLSYSHDDKKYLKDFLKHIKPTETSGLVSEIWYDEKINGGKPISENVKQNLEDADVVVLFISPNWLASPPCLKEYETASALKKDIFPIILDHCDWKPMFADIKASPKDGKPLASWKNKNEAWLDVIKILRELLSNIALKRKEFTKQFQKFINNPGDFMGSTRPDALKLRDFYVPLPLKERILDPRIENKGVISAKLLEHVKKTPSNKFFIFGDEQSGKTALCQILCEKYKNAGKFPVYIDGKNVSNDNLGQMERSAFAKQYKNIKSNNVKDKEKIVIFDDFAYEGKIKEHDIRSLIRKICEKDYHTFILITSSIAKFTSLFWEEFLFENNFSVYDIERISYSKRTEIIEKWINATHIGEDAKKIRNLVDQKRESFDAMFVEDTLPLTPFYILMTLNLMSSALSFSVYKSDIGTSYGHCYNAIITHQFYKIGIEAEDFGGCHNFLTELAFYMYENEISEINDNHMRTFHRKYEKIYMKFPSHLAERLFKSAMFPDNRRMEEYVFYYYAAKRLSDDMNAGDDDRQKHVKKDIDRILSEAHKKRYGHILLFLVHHMPKNTYLQNKLNEEMNSLFKGEKEAILDGDETRHLDEFISKISQPTITGDNSEKAIKDARDAQIKKTEKERKADVRFSRKAEQTEDETFITFSKSFRMIKIAGSLLKNEYRTMKKENLERLSLSTRDVTFRIIASLIRENKDYPNQVKALLTAFLSRKDHEWKNLSTHEKERRLKEFTGMLYVGFSLEMIRRCVWSIGFEELAESIGKISKTEEQPSSQLLHLTTKLWYKKDLDIPEIKKLHEKWKKDHLLADALLLQIVCDHLEMHAEEIEKRQQVLAIFETDPRTVALIQHKRIKK